ncbi:serine protease inhibitor swm-1-like isoform X2 [Hyperolius riggenbachi]|uniref:serine protease inhibitor swm-1-like isoform X2 n=1 Tax=Hyperolius riggenbachi TaxID=752182 RepID=UPI0035A39ED2
MLYKRERRIVPAETRIPGEKLHRNKAVMGKSRVHTAVPFLCLALAVLFIGECRGVPTGSCPPNASPGCRLDCRSSCDTLNLTLCSKECLSLCECNEGFVFQSKESDVCVPVQTCHVTCPQNSHFNECYKQPQVTCDTWGIHYQQSEKCFPRCLCDDNYVLSDEPAPRCIKLKTCPQFRGK